jgi:hypothetical protein
MADVQLTRFAFLRKGFDCPVQGCGQHIANVNIQEPTGVALGRQVPTGYLAQCPRCRALHVVHITDPEVSTVPEQQMTRYAFLHEGFTCPVQGCGEIITQADVEQTDESIGESAPSFYIVRCLRCWTSLVVSIKEEKSANP